MKFYAILLSTLLITQPLKCIIPDNRYNEAIVCLLFFGGCALLGIISSYLKTRSIESLKIQLTNISNEIINLQVEIKKRDTNIPLGFAEIDTLLTNQKQEIEKLNGKLSYLAKQNTQLQTTITSNMPALAALYWHSQYMQLKLINDQTKNMQLNNCPILK